MKLFLTGEVGTGKTTVFTTAVDVLTQRGVDVRGFATPEVHDERGRRGFDVVDLATGAHVPLRRWPGAPSADDCPELEMTRHGVYVGPFESVVRPALEDAPPGALLAIDEVGMLEFRPAWFRELWTELLGGPTDLFAVVGRKHLPECEGRGEILEVTMENRESLPIAVAGAFLARR